MQEPEKESAEAGCGGGDGPFCLDADRVSWAITS